MSAVGEAKLVISASDHTGEAFQSIARKVEALGRTTKAVGEAAGSVGRIAAEVDKISASVGRSSAAVDRFAGVLKVAGEASSGIGRVAAQVDRAASTMPRLTADATAMAKAMQNVTAAERALAAESDRLARAGSKLTLFKELQSDLKGARGVMGQAQRDLAGYTDAIAARQARIAQLRDAHGAAVAAQNAASRDVTEAPGRADAADEALFRAKADARQRSLDAYNAAVRTRKSAEVELAQAADPRGGEKLQRQQAGAAKAAELARAGYEMQRGAVRALKGEIEGLAGPMLSVSSVERRLVADAEAATRAFEDQGAAATRAGEAAVRAVAREEEARARQAASNERWMRQYRDLEARAGREAASLAPRGRPSAVEALAMARRLPERASHASTAGHEAAAVARAQLNISAFREVQATAAELRRAAREAQADAARVGRDVRAARAPSPELLADHARAGEAASSATAAFERQAGVLKGLKAEIEGVIGPMHSLASAEAQMAQRATAADAALKRQETRHRRLHAVGSAAEDLLPFEGPEILHLTGEAYREGAQVQHERVGLQNAGRTPEQIEEIERRSREVSGALPTATTEENLKVVAETTGAFGSLDHALEHLQFMQQTMSILHTAAGDKIHEGPGEVGRYIAKFFEDRQTKPEEFERQASSLIPAMVATGGVFNPREMYMFAQQAKSSLPGYDQEFLSKYMPALIARSDGDKTGTAANAFTNTITGKARDGKQAAAWLKLGLLDPTMLTAGSKGPVGWSAGAVKNTDGAIANPVRWAEDTLIPAMKAHGIDTDNRSAVMKQLATMFRNNTANYFANEIAQAVSLSLLHKDAGLYDQVGNADDIYKRNLHEDPTVALGALGDVIKTFAADVTSPAMKDVANVLGTTAEGLAHLGNSVSEWDAAHPQAAKAIAGGALGGGLAIGGLLTGMLFTNLKSLFSGAGTAAAAAEMATAGALQVEAGQLMLAAAGKGGLPAGPPAGGLPGGGAPGTPGGSPGYASLGFRSFLLAMNLGSAAVAAPDPASPEGQKAMAGTDERIAAANRAASDATGGLLPAEGGDAGMDLALRGRAVAKSLWNRIFGSSTPAAAAVPPAPAAPAPLARPPVRPTDLTTLSAPASPAVLPVALAALPPRALPPAPTAMAPVPVHVVSTAANIPLASLGPGLHRDFTLGNRRDDFASPGLGAGPGFTPFPGHHAPAFTPMSAHATSLEVAPHVDLSGLDGALGKVGEAKDALAGLGAMNVAPQVSLAAIDALIAKLLQAKSLAASLGSGGGGGTLGSVGPSRVVADPGVGRSR